MGILFSDAFDSYGVTADMLSYWGIIQSSAWAFNATAGRNGGGAMVGTAAAAIVSRIGVLNSNTVVGAGFWMKFSAAPAAAYDFVNYVRSDGVVQGALRLNTSGQLVMRDVPFSSDRFTGATNVCDNQWHWVEHYLTMTNVSLSQKCYVDGITQWNTGFNVGSAGATLNYVYLSAQASRTVTIDDFIVFDASNGAPIPSDIPLGPRLMTTIRGNGDVATGFTRSSGASNFSMVNEVAADGDATYNEGTTSGDADLFDYANLGINPASINAVVAKMCVENPNPGTINVRQAVKSVSTTTQGSTIVASSLYNTFAQPFPVDPNTSAAWTVSGLDAAQFGYNIP